MARDHDAFVIVHGTRELADVVDAVSSLSDRKPSLKKKPRAAGETLSATAISWGDAGGVVVFGADDVEPPGLVALAHSLSGPSPGIPVLVLGDEGLATYFSTPGSSVSFAALPGTDEAARFVADELGFDVAEEEPEAPATAVSWPKGRKAKRLFKVLVQVETFAFARSAREAERLALEGAPEEIKDNKAGVARAAEVTDTHEIPVHWHDCIPWGEEDDRTVAEILAWAKAGGTP